MKWTKLSNQNFTQDNRGWKKGIKRKWNKATEKKIKQIYQEVENNPIKFYSGATAIDLEWRKKYPESPPPLRTIGKILSDLGLSSKRRKDRHKGAARYLCYPEHTIYVLLNGRVLEADFIGSKYITGRTRGDL